MVVRLPVRIKGDWLGRTLICPSPIVFTLLLPWMHFSVHAVPERPWLAVLFNPESATQMRKVSGMVLVCGWPHLRGFWYKARDRSFKNLSVTQGYFEETM
ncbi:hypothetical protein ATO67_08895 [Agrobacterium bohemicum]|uniref:Uncharacterized protein n=1 Tax=Agrobacterium bohemicum TaxID=2052828 RepID=A0A135P1P8_9HYPH|nr:hypothetical protein ATO67_08895 [Agrobacterium bohemicum]